MVIALVCGFLFVTLGFLLLVLRRHLINYDRLKDGLGRHTTVVLGSGGHTTEMLRLLTALDPQKYQPTTFVVADTDNFSLDQVARVMGQACCDSRRVIRVPRSREVKQSWSSSVWTTLRQELFFKTFELLRENISNLAILIF